MTEPRTLEEMTARKRAAEHRMWAAGRSFCDERRADLSSKFRRVAQPPSRLEPLPMPPEDGQAVTLAAHLARELPFHLVERLEEDLRNPFRPPSHVWARAKQIAFEAAIPTILLFGRTRVRAVVITRQEFALRLHELGRYSLPQIGRYLGGKDHTTILHAIRRARMYRAQIANPEDNHAEQ